MNGKKMKIIVASLLCITSLFMFSCGSDKTGDNGDPELGDVFVSTDGSTGSVELDVNQTRLLVGETSGFRFFVRGANGRPVSDIVITCSAEAGVAINEGSGQLTNNNAELSGQILCTSPGSFRMGCRTPQSSVRQDSVTIVCL